MGGCPEALVRFLGLGGLPEVAAAGRGPGGAERDRTANLLVANEALSQLSYGPRSGSDRPATVEPGSRGVNGAGRDATGAILR